MAVLSKFLNTDLKLDDPDDHHLTDHRFLFLASSTISSIIWISALVFHHRTDKRNDNSLDEVSTSYLLKTNRDKRKTEPIGKVLTQLVRILNKCLCKHDVYYAIGIAFALVMRTMCDLWMIKNGTQIEAAIINSDYNKLKLNMLEFLYAAPILALVNNGLKFCMNRLQLNLRYSISSYLTTNYVEGLTYYRINALDNKFTNIDQLLTNDVDKFSQILVDVYCNMAKPLLDILIYVRKLSVNYTGAITPAILFGYMFFSGGILTNARKPITRMTLKESQLEGELRFVHSRMINNCEEIAFYQGNKRENVTLKNALDRLREHLMQMMVYKFNVDYLDNMLFRYFGTICGYLALSLPFLNNRYTKINQTQKQETYYKSGRIMINLAMTCARLVAAGRDLNKLLAYTQRVNDLIEYMNNENSLQNTLLPAKSRVNGRELIPFSGQIEYCDPYNPMIEMFDVPLCTPSGEVLVDSLNFKVLIGQNVIITGPNGSGKSSLFRLLGELWPLYGGKLIKPTNKHLFYIPQKPYMALGNFRDQIIYPDTNEDLQRKMITDDDLKDILKIVQLEYLLERESFDSVQDWQEVLSGGEKQRMAIARLIYQKPQFAILDECTSAVSVDVEQSIYEYLCDQKFCSLLSVTHRVKQLQKYHDYILNFDGTGSCSFSILIDDDDN